MFTEKPYLLSEPKDLVTVAGQNIEFECQVGGEPEPRILWRRDDGKNLPVCSVSPTSLPRSWAKLLWSMEL